MKYSILILGIVTVLAWCLSGCYNRNEAALYPEPNNCDTSNVTFSGTIQPILNQHCAITGCHTGPDPTGGYNYSSFPDVHKVASLGLLLKVINHKSGYPQMPKDAAKLDQCTIDKFTAWVNAGALDN